MPEVIAQHYAPSHATSIVTHNHGWSGICFFVFSSRQCIQSV